MPESLLELKNICKYYTGAQSVVVGLNSVDLSFRSGEFVAVTGESGSGKSTLAHIISGILPYESGEMLLGGRPTSHYDSGDWERYRRERISFISQSYGILPGSTVLGNVVSALRITGMEPKEAKARAEELLKMVELWELRSRRAGKLSSGQKQRLSIARALAKPAPILVADEPTGNLDPKNSAKVIELLAQAAQERLVILITHDFQEAEGYATRRVILQDGRVVTDAVLREFVPAEKKPAARRKKRNLSPFVSRLQISGRPVWSALVLLFFALTAFGVFAFLGTFIVNLDDTSTRIYDDSAFLNGSKTRIVVQREDLQAMTETDWETILSVEDAEVLERNGYLADWQYAWQLDVDYTVSYSLSHTGGDSNRHISVDGTPIMETDKMTFMQTVPMYADGREFLTAGRLPETMYEVVLAGEPERIGEIITVFFQDTQNWGTGSYVELEVTVVGTTDQGSGLYFADELGRVIGNFIIGGGVGHTFMVAPTYDKYATMQTWMLQEWGLLREDSLIPASEGWIILPSMEDIGVFGLEDPNYWQLETIPVYLEGSELGMEMDMDVAGLCKYGIGLFENARSVTLNREKLREQHPEITEMELDYLEEQLQIVSYRIRVDEQGRPTGVDGYLDDDGYCAIAQTLLAGGYHGVEICDFSDPNVDITDKDNYQYFTAVGCHDSTFKYYVNVTPATFDRIAWDGNSNQVSLTISDYAYTDQVIDALQEKGYLAISVYRQGATEKNPVLASQRMTTLQVCLAALMAVVLLQVLVLKELFGIQWESYKLLADMGLGCATAQRSLLWQVLAFTVCGQLLGFGAIGICGAMGIERIESILRYLPAGNWVILSLVHLVVSLVTGLLTMRSMKKKVYPQSAQRGDLDLDEEVAE